MFAFCVVRPIGMRKLFPRIMLALKVSYLLFYLIQSMSRSVSVLALLECRAKHDKTNGFLQAHLQNIMIPMVLCYWRSTHAGIVIIKNYGGTGEASV